MKLKKELEKKHNKKEKGITLVALVITVVIMLILAAVAIGSVTGDGLFNRTRQAAEAYENASKKESDQIQELMNEIDEYLTGENDNEGVDPGEVAVVGDFVNYSVVVDGETYDKWRILDLDNNGHMEIVCYNGPKFTLGSSTESTAKTQYANAIKILNDKSVPYGEGTYGESTRHLGSDPGNPSSYETIDESYIKFYEDYNNIESNANYPFINQTHHESDLVALKSFNDSDKLAESYSWLASRVVTGDLGKSYFYVRAVSSSGSLYNRYLFLVYSDGSESGSSYSRALAPVVILESGVKIDTSTGGNGSEESPWTLTK